MEAPAAPLDQQGISNVLDQVEADDVGEITPEEEAQFDADDDEDSELDEDDSDEGHF